MASKRVMWGIKASRFIRSSTNSLKKKIRGSKEGTPGSLFGETILPDTSDRSKKYKSTLAVGAAGTAIGVSHVAAASGKFHKSVSGKVTLLAGVTTGALMSYVWYNYVDAANEGVSEDDIAMMFEMANSTGYGSLDDDKDSSKAVDILHAMVTGKVEPEGESTTSLFKYEDEDEDDDDDPDVDSDVFSQKSSFSDDGMSIKPSTKRGFGQTGIGKSLSKNTVRKSFLPELDQQDVESEREEVEAGWMDFSHESMG